MTAGAARLEREPSIRLVPSDSAPGLGTSVRNGVRTFFGKIAGFFSSAWNWLKRTLHLDAVGDRVAGGYRWARVQGGRIVSLLGPDGLLGAGLLATSTSYGRKAIGFVLRPIGWVLDLFAKGYTWTERALANKSDGGIRNWISDRMRSMREFLFGEPALTVVGGRSTKSERRVGVVNSVILWFAQTFGGLLHTDSVAMRLARTAGTLLLGRRGVMMLALLPLGALLTPAMIVGTGLMLWGAVAPWESEVTSTWNKFRGQAKTAGTQAAKIVEATEADLTADIETAGEAVTDTSNGSPVTPVNRAARRGHPAGKASVRRTT
ncbi:MAG TPA: hypothetical protein VIT65_22365 [Microlunatus sp.]